jgi:hypothetical protein
MSLELGAGTQRYRIRILVALAALVLAGTVLALRASTAHATANQIALFEDDPAIQTNAFGTLQQLHALGADTVRLAVRWQQIAPRSNSRKKPRHFNGANPASYPAGNWALWDGIVRNAQDFGIALDFNVLGGAPLWATGRGAPRNGPHHNWEPSPKEFGAFMRALGTRYSGHYLPRGSSTPLPRVNVWSVWNEPDYGPSLAPQGVYPNHLKVENSPRMYRNLVNAAWSALHRTGHGGDRFIIGEIAPRGEKQWGIFSGMKPVTFLRAMYCVDRHWRPLRGGAARIRGCPANRAASRRFRSRNPGLFQASAFSDHPYMRWYRPNHEAQYDPQYTSLGEIGVLKRTLDRLQRVYRSGKHYPIWDTEFGYITSPPKHRNKYPWARQDTAAFYINWAEYIHWRDRRLVAYDQYLLHDPLPPRASNDWGGFASGLLNFDYTPKPLYNAYRLPLYMPKTSGNPLEVWGDARPARFALAELSSVPENVQVQWAPRGGGFSTVATVRITNPHGYFDTRVRFPGAGTVRLMYTYPSGDPRLPAGQTVVSRYQNIS